MNLHDTPNQERHGPPGAARTGPSSSTFRLYRDQLLGLQREALDRHAEGAAGRADASAVLRDVIDEHFATKAQGTRR